MKTCSKCRQTKSVIEFFANRRKKDGLQERCKECHRAVVHRMYDRDHAAIVQRAREAGCVKTCTQCGIKKPVTNFFTFKAATDGFRPDCKDCLKSKKRAYYDRERPKILEQTKAYAQKNAQAVKVMHQKAHRRRSEDPEWLKKAREKTNEWARAHKSERALNQRRRIARLANSPVNDFTNKQWQAIKASYGNRCAYCGIDSRRLCMEHVIPLSRNGLHTARNIVPSCRPCNTRKGNRPHPPFRVIPTAFVT